MPRQIRFRVWDPIEKTMMYPEPTSLTCAIGLDGHIFNAEELAPLDGVVLMLSTGLKDRHGREIFEGDLIGFDYKSGTGHLRPFPEVVEWDETNACFQPFTPDSEFGPLVNYKESKIIGNVWENAELVRNR